MHVIEKAAYKRLCHKMLAHYEGGAYGHKSHGYQQKIYVRYMRTEYKSWTFKTLKSASVIGSSSFKFKKKSNQSI